MEMNSVCLSDQWMVMQMEDLKVVLLVMRWACPSAEWLAR